MFVYLTEKALDPIIQPTLNMWGHPTEATLNIPHGGHLHWTCEDIPQNLHWTSHTADAYTEHVRTSHRTYMLNIPHGGRLHWTCEDISQSEIKRVQCSTYIYFTVQMLIKGWVVHLISWNFDTLTTKDGKMAEKERNGVHIFCIKKDQSKAGIKWIQILTQNLYLDNVQVFFLPK